MLKIHSDDLKLRKILSIDYGSIRMQTKFRHKFIKMKIYSENENFQVSSSLGNMLLRSNIILVQKM
jgi:hypothetical protein